MVSLLSQPPSIHPLFFIPTHHRYHHHSHRNHTHNHRYPLPLFSRRRSRLSIVSIANNSIPPTSQNKQPRTVYPGGYKRPEIRVPSLVLQLSVDEVLDRAGVLDVVDEAVSKWVGVVVLDGGDGSGGRLYEAACLLKSVVRERAYLMVAERVDIAAAVNANGVVLSDKGLPAIVARNTMMDSRSESVILPLVARNVQTANAAFTASNSEGADFLLYGAVEEKQSEVLATSVFENVKIPIFAVVPSRAKDTSLFEASELLKAGASGLVFSLEDLRLFSDDVLRKLFETVHAMNKRTEDELQNLNKLKSLDVNSGVPGKRRVAGFIKLEDREKEVIETERLVLLEAINIIQKAAPLMEEVSLLIDAVSQLDEPFLLAIVGEFNSGKSTVINALLGRRYLKEGVVPTTNEITFLRYSELDSDGKQRCERHPDGQYICYLPAPILKEMNIVDTPGTNVILQRQQRLTEEFVPRADLLLFVISADRPLTESEVAFLRYTQQWRKKIVFVLNKADLYQNASELEEAVSFIKKNVQKLLNVKHVILYPVSASFLDGSTSTGMERMRLKLETPIGIAERLFSSCETLVRQDYQYAKQDLASINEMVSSVKEYAVKMESENISWRRQTLSLIDTTKARIVKLIDSTLQLSNLDLVGSYVLKGAKSATLPATSSVQNDIIGPAHADARKLLGEYVTWLQSNNAHEGRLYKESFERKWPLFVYPHNQVGLETYELLRKGDELSLKALENFSAGAASRLFDQEIREVFLGVFGGLGAAGFSASLLTSVLPTTLEDLLALGLCSAGGWLAISNFPARRKGMIEKVTRAADAFARELEVAMQKDLLETVENLENFVKLIAKPYQDEAQNRLDKLLEIQDELSNVEKKLQTLQIQIQNLHVS
ncbi:hypothetical protein VitviT2T_009357 [Vitis vinifera]|uniref:Transmembrane GTPase FZO-like, chloroplastic n=1 Tax=Vitis vinifera TaxID=29760 RepID=A0ABY9C5D5_VITVI|nr:hypothetical protein VitviT2T_009357 [Vitis vinifera]